MTTGQISGYTGGMEMAQSLTQKIKAKSRGDIHRGTGIHLSHVSRVFSGKRSASAKNVEVLAKFFGVEMGEMYRHLQSIRVRYLSTRRKTGKTTAA